MRNSCFCVFKSKRSGDEVHRFAVNWKQKWKRCHVNRVKNQFLFGYGAWCDVKRVFCVQVQRLYPFFFTILKFYNDKTLKRTTVMLAFPSTKSQQEMKKFCFDVIVFFLVLDSWTIKNWREYYCGRLTHPLLAWYVTSHSVFIHLLTLFENSVYYRFLPHPYLYYLETNSFSKIQHQICGLCCKTWEQVKQIIFTTDHKNIILIQKLKWEKI